MAKNASVNGLKKSHFSTLLAAVRDVGSGSLTNFLFTLYQHIDNNDNVVSIESLLRGGTTMVSVSREDNHSAGQVSLGKTAMEPLPIKKRRLAKENRERCNSMPVGNFSSGDAKSAESFRTHSLSGLCEKFAEKDFLANPASVKELENKYGLINLRENTAVIRKRRPGSFDELLAAFEKNSCRSSGISNLTDDAMNRIAGDRTVKQTLKRVSAAFSDISANFSPEKTPTSSTEELTEDLTGPDDDDFRVFQENKDMYQYMDDPQKEGSVSSVESKAYQNDFSRGSDKEVGAVWNHLQIPSDSFSTSPSNEDEDTSINDLQSSEDRNSTLLSERSSCADTLSDSCDERYEDPRFSTNRFNGTYQKVFCLKRAFSEENLVSKSAFNETMNGSGSSYTAGIASRSYSQFGQKHLPIVRSKSMESSSVRRWSDSHPFSFCVTPKKKIVIKDRLWETIKEDPEISNHEKTSLDRDGRLVRRRRKRRTSQENKKNVKKGAGVGESENVNRKRVFSTGASLEIGEYRTAKSEQKSDARDDKQSRSAVQHKRGEGTTTRPPPNASRNVTKVEVALKRRNAKLKGEKNVVRVDANVSVVPHSINYLCIEKIPSDERPTRNGHIESGAEDNLKSDATSKVEQLSKYFSEFKPVDNKRKSKRTNSLRNLKNVKKRIEEMKLRERNFLKASTALKKEEVVKAELDSIQNIKDRIDELRRSTVDEEQTAAKMKDLQSALNEGIHNVKHLKNRIEAIASNNPSSAEADSQFNEEELGKQLQSRLHIRDCAEKLQRSNVKENNDDRNIKLDENFNEELRTRQRIKDCIERLQKGTKREVESGMDITISDESERVESLSSPRRNEELRTVVIKRGWVQQFIQKIETGS